MLPSSSSQLARHGQINHYKKFWLLQTQLEKQDQSSTSLSLGVTGNANIPTVGKESKPLSSSLVVNGDHFSNNMGGAHGSCRADIVSSSTSCSGSRAGVHFPYCSNEPSSINFYPNNLGYNHMSNGSLRDSPPLISLAVNCENVAHINFVNQRWSSASLQPTAVSDLHPPLSVNYTLSHPGNRQQLLGTSGAAEECESSDCSTGGEKRGLWDVTSSSHSTTTNTTTAPFSTHNFAVGGQECTPPSTNLTSLHLATVPSSSFRTGHGSGTPLRTCSLCGTTKTPLWRSGPDGPKSLCNACGIRVKKSKRLQAAMEAAGGTVIGSSSSSPSSSYKQLPSNTKSAGGGALKRKHSIQAAENQSDPIYQKRKKVVGFRRNSGAPPNVAEVGGEYGYWLFSSAGDDTTKMAAGAGLVVDSRSSVSSNIFAKDVEEAAVLLMALSCGRVLS